MRKVRLIVLGVVLATSALVVGPLHAGTKTKTLGNSKTGAYFTLNWLFKLDPNSAKSIAKLGAEIGARLFKKKFPIAAAEGRVGNYAAADLNLNKNKTSYLVVEKAKKWKMVLEIDLFGATVLTKSRNFTKDTTIADYNKVFGKSFPAVTFMVGPVPFSIQYGANLDYGIKPRFKPLISFKNGKISELGVEGAVLPHVGVSAFAEGGVNVYFLRGGVGASLTLFEGKTGPGLELALLKAKRFALNWITEISILKGRIYAYVDRRKYVVFGKWKRWLDITIFNWNGFSWDWKKKLYAVDWDFNPKPPSYTNTYKAFPSSGNSGPSGRLSFAPASSTSLVRQSGGIYAAPYSSGLSLRISGLVPASYRYAEKRWSRAETDEYYRMKKEADAQRRSTGVRGVSR